MPSPFPGMNPYMEQESVWHDFHENFLPMAAGNPQRPGTPSLLRQNRRAHVRPRTRPGRAASRRRGDLWVAPLTPERGSGGTTELLEAPGEVGIPQIDVEGQSFLEIRDRDTRQLITVVELLSPSNKYRGPDREQYLGKTRQLLQSNVHFVEIDLLRGRPADAVAQTAGVRFWRRPQPGRAAPESRGVADPGCATGCRSSRCRCGKAIPTRPWTSKKCSTASTTPPATTITSTPTNPSRPCRWRTLPRHNNSCRAAMPGRDNCYPGLKRAVFSGLYFFSSCHFAGCAPS